ncbi:MAG: hypothetical protein OEY52_09410 [Gammaproteobacteria bacterium]|nr:hypothetical protein [Gammaproteobacteria bacterium]
MFSKVFLVISCLFISSVSLAGDVSIRHVEFQKSSADWTANVTLEHGDTGWKHYADAWRIVDTKGNVLGTRTLWHPHVDEQPFTRSLSGINIPTKTTKVYVEAHDKVHGWSKDRVLVDLRKTSGKRYKVR